MGRLLIEGDTLGKKKRHYNQLIKDAASKPPQAPNKISSQDSDIENLFKIDTACVNKDVDYILDVLKSDDTLYTTRAIKGSTWMITDPQYAHIINPEYLHTQLFPHMITKAKNKLLLYIRLNLKDEIRAEEFYNYYKDKDRRIALKWLTICPIIAVEKEATRGVEYTELSRFKRISKRSLTVLDKHTTEWVAYRSEILKANLSLLNTDADQYMNIIDKVSQYELPRFGVRATANLMKKCPQKIIDDFSKFYDRINIKTFAKYFEKADIQKFLLKYANKEGMLWFFVYDNLKHFIRYMPAAARFELLNRVYFKKVNSECINIQSNELYSALNKCRLEMGSYSTVAENDWYTFARFDETFTDLKQIIRTESSPEKRNSMLLALIKCAKHDINYVHSLLQYYSNKHSNEPIKFKIEFFDSLLSQTNQQQFDEKIWHILNKMFNKMGVYAKRDNTDYKVQLCVQSIIIYKVLHNEKVPNVIENKFVFNSLNSLPLKLSKAEEEKIFNYLYNHLVTKINNKHIETECDLSEVIELLNNLMWLLKNWKKDLVNFPFILTKIKTITDLKRNKSWELNMSELYNKHKSWRKYMFHESLAMCPSESTCLNALEHGPELLERSKSEVEALQCNDSVSLNRFLSTLRVYWPDSLAKAWAESYIQRLDTTTGHKAIARGICTLLPQAQLIDILEKHKPTENKISWNEDAEVTLSLCKQFAKNMYHARPHPPLDILISYSSGDYLQYGLASLNSVLNNMSPSQCQNEVTQFLNAPVPLQKHGIRMVYTKVKPQEMKQLFSDAWKSTRNLTIRSVLFKNIFDFLCRETDPLIREEVWEVLSMFIDNLSQEEDRIVYGTIAKYTKLPRDVRAKFCTKGYNYLKSLPAKENVEGITTNMVIEMRSAMQDLDSNFVANILLNSRDKITSKVYDLKGVMTSYILCTKDEISQNERYEKVLAPFLEYALSQWDVKVEGKKRIQQNIKDLLLQFIKDICEYVFELNMVFPIKVFTNIQCVLEKKLNIVTEYLTLRKWDLAIRYLKLLEEQKSNIAEISAGFSEYQLSKRTRYYQGDTDSTFDDIFIKVASGFTEQCYKSLESDMQSYYPSIYRLFGKVLLNLFYDIGISKIALFETLKCMYQYNDSPEFKLVVIKVMPPFHYYTESINEWRQIRKTVCSTASGIVKMNYYLKYDNHNYDDDVIGEK